MQIITTKESLLKYYSETGLKTASIGFVPTMGALHNGHLHLIDRAVSENEVVICSIFVNPTQFNNPEDLKNYPSTLDADIEKLKKTGCTLLFLPSVNEMYDNNLNTIHFDLDALESVMEGSSRPGHFQGVCTIVFKLFSIIEPLRAYFGLKDFQQIAVIRKMVEQTKMPVEIVPCEIVREKDGLAMSSRNMRLNSIERAEAPFLYSVLKMASALAGNKSLKSLNEMVVKAFTSHPLFELDYFTIVNASTLLPIEDWNETKNLRACIAATLGKIRLIDNVAIIL